MMIMMEGDIEVMMMMGDIIVDYGRRGYRSKYTSHFSSLNAVETVGGDGRVGYRSQTRHSSYHNSCDHVRLLSIT